MKKIIIINFVLFQIFSAYSYQENTHMLAPNSFLPNGNALKKSILKKILEGEPFQQNLLKGYQYFLLTGQEAGISLNNKGDRVTSFSRGQRTTARDLKIILPNVVKTQKPIKPGEIFSHGHWHPFQQNIRGNMSLPFPSLGDLKIWREKQIPFPFIGFGEELALGIEGNIIVFFDGEHLPSEKEFEIWLRENPFPTVKEHIDFFSKSILEVFWISPKKGDRTVSVSFTECSMEKFEQFLDSFSLKNQNQIKKGEEKILKNLSSLNSLEDLEFLLDSFWKIRKGEIEKLIGALLFQISEIETFHSILTEGGWRKNNRSLPHAFKGFVWGIKVRTAIATAITRILISQVKEEFQTPEGDISITRSLPKLLEALDRYENLEFLESHSEVLAGFEAEFNASELPLLVMWNDKMNLQNFEEVYQAA